MHLLTVWPQNRSEVSGQGCVLSKAIFSFGLATLKPYMRLCCKSAVVESTACSLICFFAGSYTASEMHVTILLSCVLVLGA